MIQKETGERINKDQKEVTEQLKGSKIGKEDHIGKETTQQVDHRHIQVRTTIQEARIEHKEDPPGHAIKIKIIGTKKEVAVLVQVEARLDTHVNFVKENTFL